MPANPNDLLATVYAQLFDGADIDAPPHSADAALGDACDISAKQRVGEEQVGIGREQGTGVTTKGVSESKTGKALWGKA